MSVRRAIPRGVVEETLRAPFLADVFFDLAEIFLAAMASSRFSTGRRHHDVRLTATRYRNRRADCGFLF